MAAKWRPSPKSISHRDGIGAMDEVGGMKVYRILLVEDDSQIVAGLSEYLQTEGFIVDRAAGQRQALRKMDIQIFCQITL